MHARTHACLQNGRAGAILSTSVGCAIWKLAEKVSQEVASHRARQPGAAQAQGCGAQARRIRRRQAPHQLGSLGGGAGQRGGECTADADAGSGNQWPVGSMQGQAARGQQEVSKQGVVWLVRVAGSGKGGQDQFGRATPSRARTVDRWPDASASCSGVWLQGGAVRAVAAAGAASSSKRATASWPRNAA